MVAYCNLFGAKALRWSLTGPAALTTVFRGQAIETANTGITNLVADIGKHSGKSAELDATIKQVEKELAANIAALDEATEVRKRENAEFSETEKDLMQSAPGARGWSWKSTPTCCPSFSTAHRAVQNVKHYLLSAHSLIAGIGRVLCGLCRRFPTCGTHCKAAESAFASLSSRKGGCV